MFYLCLDLGIQCEKPKKGGVSHQMVASCSPTMGATAGLQAGAHNPLSAKPVRINESF